MVLHVDRDLAACFELRRQNVQRILAVDEREGSLLQRPDFLCARGHLTDIRMVRHHFIVEELQLFSVGVRKAFLVFLASVFTKGHKAAEPLRVISLILLG